MARDDKNHGVVNYWMVCMFFPISVFPHCVVPMQVDEECCSICRPLAGLGREKSVAFFFVDMTFAFKSPMKQKVETKTWVAWGIFTRFKYTSTLTKWDKTIWFSCFRHLDPKVQQAICDFMLCFQMWR